jgi:hypothetical protein
LELTGIRARPGVIDDSSGFPDKGRTGMASSGKQKTTTAKRVREAKLRERRIEKQARKDARKLAASDRADAFADPAESPPAGEAHAPPDFTQG